LSNFLAVIAGTEVYSAKVLKTLNNLKVVSRLGVGMDNIEKIDKGLLLQKWMGQKILPILNQNGCDIDEPWQVDMSLRWLKNNAASSD